MDGTKTTTNWIIAGLVALVVIIGGGWLIARERAGTVSGTQKASTESATGNSATDSKAPVTGNKIDLSGSMSKGMTVSAVGETITVADQSAGTEVLVEDVKLSKPSWVAVRDTRGWYPGAAWLSESQSNVTIPLLRSTEAGSTYEVVIFVDDGDKEFSIHGGDMLVTGTEGAPVSSTFTAK